MSENKINCVIYCRVSTAEQVEGFSLDGQEGVLREYASKNNMEVIDTYIDAGISGKDTNRPEFKRLCKNIFNKNNTIDCVLVYKLSRLSRKMIDSLTFYENINKFNKRLIIVEDNIDTDTAQGKLMLTMLSVVSEMERDNIISQVHNGMYQKAKEGEWNGRAPYGYDLINKKLIINQKEADIVKLIFDLYLNKNKGYKAIAIYLNELNIPTKKGTTWSLASIKEKLINPTYCGYVCWNRQNRSKTKNKDVIKVKGKHTSIIEEDIWEKVQNKISNSPGKFKRVHKGEFLLSGILKCPVCGGSMVGYRRLNPKNGQVYKYYQCNNARTKGAKVCSHNLVHADYTEKYVLKKISKLVNNKGLLKLIYNKITKNYSSDTNNIKTSLQSVEKSIESIDIKLTNLIEMKLANELTSNEFINYKRKLLIEKESLYTKRTDLNKQLSNVTDTTIPLESVALILNNFYSALNTSSDSTKKLLIKALISKITIKAGNNPDERTVDKIYLHIEPSNLDLAQSFHNNFPTIYDKVPLLLF